MIETVLVSGAAAVAIAAGFVAAMKWVGRGIVTQVNELIDLKVDPIEAELTKQFGGNGNGARQAINELHSKVDDGFAEATKEMAALTVRVNAIDRKDPE